jgi:transcription initiation factor TFIIH subunit 2
MSRRRPVQKDADRDDDDVQSVAKGYVWESTGQRSWDQIVEDPTTGRLKSFGRQEQIARKRRRDHDAVAGVRRGIIRFSVLVLDSSYAMSETDLKPSRAEAVCAACGEYVREYFDQNPISQLSVITTRDGIASRLSGLSSNPDVHIDAIQEALRLGPYGDASLMNALTLARGILAPIPAYGTREIVIAYGSLSTCDPGNIHDVVDALVEEKVRCSAVGLGAELTILKTITEKTAGVYRVALGEDHFSELMSEHVIPPPTTSSRTPASLIRMGFPMLKRLDEPKQYWNNPDVRPRRVGYECPRCRAWLSEMPCECVLCGLTLVSSPHLARSYHHLFPVPKFVSLEEKPKSRVGDADDDDDDDDDVVMREGEQPATVRCTGCLKLLASEASLRLLCPRCKHVFCLDCDTFVHDGLHYCPSCGADETTSILANG